MENAIVSGAEDADTFQVVCQVAADPYYPVFQNKFEFPLCRTQERVHSNRVVLLKYTWAILNLSDAII